MSIRAKMVLQGMVPNTYGDGAQAVFCCHYDSSKPEDVGFSKATPSGDARFQIDNPKAAEQLVVGKAYYFDISPAD
jgi:hypothetical protein